MINGALILLFHLVAVIVSFFLIRFEVLKVDRLMLAIIICIPVFGFVSAVLVSMLIRMGKVGTKSKDLENMKSSNQNADTILVEAPESVNVVPLEDALIMDDPSVRRSVMLDVLMSNTEGYLPVINEARMNDDVEVVHYATTAMVEISKDYELRAQEYSSAYAEDPLKEGLIDEYIGFLKQYVGSGMIQGQILEIQRNTLMQLLAEKVSRSDDPEDFEELIVTLFAEKLYSLAKIGPASVRFKDVDDMYYLIENKSIDVKTVRKCLELLTINPLSEIKDIQDVINKAADTLENHFFIDGYNGSGGSWLNKNYQEIKKCLIEYIFMI